MDSAFALLELEQKSLITTYFLEKHFVMIAIKSGLDIKSCVSQVGNPVFVKSIGFWNFDIIQQFNTLQLWQSQENIFRENIYNPLIFKSSSTSDITKGKQTVR